MLHRHKRPLWLVFAAKQAIFSNYVMSFDKRFEIEWSSLLKGNNLVDCISFAGFFVVYKLQ